MVRRLGRRKFLVYGSAAAATGIGLKACTTNTPSASVDSASPASTATDETAGQPSDRTVKIGLLHSLSGAMALSEIAVMDAEKFAIDQINAAGGVLGQQIEAIVEDGASDWPTFAEKAEKLLGEDQVAAIFGCWTPESYQAVMPVVEVVQRMLWYPLPQTDSSCSASIIYGGAAPNQQIEPAVDWLLENQGKQIFLIESQVESPELSISSKLREYLKAKEGELVGEVALPLIHTDFSDALAQIKKALPKGGIILNRLNGESNLDFFKQLKDAGMKADQYPVMSVTISEDEIRQIGAEYLAGHYATWNYFQTLDTEENQAWVKDFQQAYGEDRVTSDPMATAYSLVYLWKQAVEQAGTLETAAVRTAAYGQTFDSPGGAVTLQSNHHLSKVVRVGQVNEDGQFKVVWSTDQALDPKPWHQADADPQTFVCTDIKDETGGAP